MNLSNAQWNFVEPLYADDPGATRARKSPVDDRHALNGVLWVLRTDYPWADLPARYPSRYVCSRRYRKWRESGLLKRILVALAEDLEARRGITASDMNLDAPPTAHGRATWWWQTVLLLRSPAVVDLMRK
jgi:transposase